jgi:NTE family protein
MTEPRPEQGAQGIALALSGGGYRAMLFHAGVLWRLNELGMLENIGRISSVSGGSLVAGILGARWGQLQFASGVAAGLREQVIDPAIRLSHRTIDAPAIALGLLPFVSVGDVTARFYRRYLVGNTTLQDLPDYPRFVFNATHLSTATDWRFSKPYMGTYRLGLVRQPRLPLSQVLAASAAFPPFLSPVVISLNPDRFERTAGADLYDCRNMRRTVALADGGVYDNLGVQTLSRGSSMLLVSDAGGGLTVKPGRFSFWTAQIRRVIDTATEQDRALRRTILMNDFLGGQRMGALWRIGTDITKFSVDCPFPVHPDWRFYLAAIRTRLNSFSDDEVGHLVNWGYLMSDLAVRSYVSQADPPASLPFPRYDFAAPPPIGRTGIAGAESRDATVAGPARSG